MTDNIHLSIIVPVYNSASFIVRSLEALDDFIRPLAFSTELIIVDDGSTDNSFDLVREWASRPRTYSVRQVALEKNLGKGAGVAKGMLEANGRFRVFLDADLAYEPSQILRIVEALEEGNDLAVACRVDEDSRYTISPAFFHYLYTRHLASRIINMVQRLTAMHHCRDTQAGLKGYTAKAAKDIFSRQRIKGFSFDIESFFLAERMGFHIREVAIEFRYFSEPTTVVFMQDGMNIGRDIFRIRLNHLLGRYRLPKKDAKKRLVINADDYGMTLPISKGILKTIEAGTVSSTSVMTNSSDFDASMDELVSHHIKPDVGLHLTLTWGKPLSDPSQIKTLVDKDGNFLSRNKLLLKCLFRQVSRDDVYREAKAQCDRLAKRWPDISHIDGHHHAHIFPVVRDAVQKIAREYRIKKIRSPNEGAWSPLHKAFCRRLLIGMLSSSKPPYWRNRGFKTNDHFGGFSLGWINMLDRLSSGTTEIMVHPGYISENKDSYNKEREDEIAVLTDPEIKARIDGIN